MMDLLRSPLQEVISRADKARREHAGNKLELCSIINAKAGRCAEDCKFCAQSCRHSTGAPSYPLKDKDQIIEAAGRAKNIGAEKFGIVTSGNRLNPKEIDSIADAIHSIKKDIGIVPCASLGALDKEELKTLREAGLTRYHHNIETSKRFYPSVVTTHLFEERLKTIEMAKETGLQVCSGGIIGMGETWQDRVDMAETLKSLGVDSVPINLLVPIKGTPYGSIDTISCDDAIRTIAIFRIILEGRIIKIAAGREAVLKDSQALGFKAGANGMLIGGYLTVKGQEVESDHHLVREIERLWSE
ncbi:MAG: biotin synthase BioB [Candidatus Omnitrophota bacterium]